MASTYQQVSYGSRGQAVRQLQAALNSKGYHLDEDGIFGEKTRAAVWDYQQKNHLQLDGIAGSETWGHLMGSASAAPSGVSEDTAAHLARLEEGYEPSFARELAALYDQISSRPSFQYDPTRDVTYQRYAADYQRRGRAAMEDTLGRSAALTGGYDSSYALAAGQQAYGRQLSELADRIPQLAESARRRYEGEGEALLKRYQLLQKQEDAAYDRWNDEVSRWRQTLEIARKAAEGAESADRSGYQAALKHYADKAKAEQRAAEAAAKLAASQAKASSSGSRSSGGSSGKTRKASLSSTAAESLERTVGAYLAAGQSAAAGALAAQYARRMTPAQRRKFEDLFGKYGRNMTR